MPKPPWAGGGSGTTPVVTGFSFDSGVAGDGLTNESSITLSGTADPDFEVRIYADGVLLGTTTSDANGDWSFATPDLADDSYSFTAEAGNGSHTLTSEPFVIEIDTVTPEPEITSATAGEIVGVELAGTAEAGASIDVYLCHVAVTFLRTVRDEYGRRARIRIRGIALVCNAVRVRIGDR